jgi:hypothetical protein
MQIRFQKFPPKFPFSLGISLSHLRTCVTTLEIAILAFWEKSWEKSKNLIEKVLLVELLGMIGDSQSIICNIVLLKA